MKLKFFKGKQKNSNENTIEKEVVIEEKVKPVEEKNGISSNKRLLGSSLETEIAMARHFQLEVNLGYKDSIPTEDEEVIKAEVKFIDLTKEGIEETEDYKNLVKARSYEKEYELIKEKDCIFEIDYKDKIMYVVANGFCIEKQVDDKIIQVEATEQDIYRTIMHQEEIVFFY